MNSQVSIPLSNELQVLDESEELIILEILIFQRLLIGGFENPYHLSGVVKLNVMHHEHHSFVALFKKQLKIIPAKECNEKIDATVTLPIEIIARINNETESIDFRDPTLLAEIQLEGDYQLVKHLVHSCQRPTQNIQQRFKKAEQLHKKHNYKNLTTIKRVHQATQYEVLKTIENGEPMIVTGLLDEHHKTITMDSLLERYADVLIKVRSNQQRLTLKDIADEFEHYKNKPYNEKSGDVTRPYTLGTTLPDEMKPDFGPMYFITDDYIKPQLWLGMLDPYTPATQIHRDPLCGFLLQILGRKRLQLVSSDQVNKLQPLKAYNNFQFCWFKPEESKNNSIKIVEVELQPGELLIQPAGWFHQTYLVDSPNMSVSYFWQY